VFRVEMRETASISTLENVKLFDLICGYFNVPVQPTNSLKKQPNRITKMCEVWESA